MSLVTLDFALDNPTTHIRGVAQLGNSSDVSFPIPNVTPGADYVLGLDATTEGTDVCTGSRGPVTCSGWSTPFSVVAGHASQASVILECGSGAVILCPPDSTRCPVWWTAVAKPPVVPLPGGSSMLQVTTSSPYPVIDYAWSAPVGTIRDVQQSPTSGTVVFTCPSTSGGSVPVTFVLSNPPYLDAGACPASDTTGTLDVVCPAPIIEADAGANGGGEAGAAADAATDTAPDAAAD